MNERQPLIDGRYRIERELGRGGFGTVHLATEIGSGELFASLDAQGAAPVELRNVALKLLDGQRVDLRRFRSEVRALCLLNHPNIVSVYNYGAEPVPWVAMELVDGLPLSSLPLPASPADAIRTLRHLIAVADALAHAHAKGVVHRDLKPQNILVDTNHHVRVVDFGLSWLVEPDHLMTQRIGTPGYLAPELIDGDPSRCDHRSDIYSFGATAHAVFCGRGPFVAAVPRDIVRAQLEAPPDLDARLPPWLRPLVERCLQREPAERPSSAASVAAELRRIARSLGVGAAAPMPDEGERVDIRDASIVAIEPIASAQRGDGFRFWLQGGVRSWESGQTERIGGFVYQGAAGSPTVQIANTIAGLRDGAEVSVFGALRIRRANADDVLGLDADSVLVVAPYFPVSVTTVAATEGVRTLPCGSRALVDLRRERRATIHILTGSILHQMLEALVHFAVDPDTDDAFDTLFDRAVRELRLDAIAAGVDDDALTRVRADLREHFPRLVLWTSPTEATRRGRVAEAARYSSRYGLEGRIDLLVSDADALRVVELKSGRRESPEHETQLRCYALMLDDLASRAGQRVDAYLLYSALGRARKLARRGPAAERVPLLARNDVIATHQWFTGEGSTPPPSWGQFPQRCTDDPCRFRSSDCREQTALLGNLSGIDDGGTQIAAGAWVGVEPDLVLATRRYYFHFVRMVEREYAASSATLGAMLRASALPERVSALEVIGDAVLESADAARRTLRFTCDHGGGLGVGDPIIAHRGDLDGGITVHGLVREIGSQYIVLDSRAAESAATQPPDGWYLEREPIRSGYRDMHRALYAFVSETTPARVERIVRPERIRAAVEPVPADALRTATARMLNEQQQLAVRYALGDVPELLVQGPPGTGKTAVIAAIVQELVERGQRVVIAAFTNTAVDTMLARVVASGVHDVLRVGSSSRGGAELLDALDAAGLPVSAHFSVDAARASASQEQLKAQLQRARVVACTANAAVGNAAMSALRTLHEGPHAFDVAILDEASQLIEPLALAIVRLAPRVVMVGDEKQLPPVIQAPENLSSIARADASGDRQGLAGLDRSLFERLRPHAPCVVLTRQYRMHPGVQEFPSRCFYGGRLEAADAAAQRRFPLLDRDALDAELLRRLDPERPAVWVEAEGETRGNLHPGEVDEVVRTAVAALRAAPVDRRSRDLVGVLSPYRAQCHAIRAALRRELGNDASLIEVDTVERFQGREKEAILISLVSAEWNDFVMDARRLNVMLTRARTKVIVFGRKALGRRMVEVFAREG